MIKKTLKLVVWLAILGGLTYGGYRFYQTRSEARAQKRPAVRTEKVSRGDFYLVISATGPVVPKDIVEIRSKASGEIKTLTFEEGDTVKQSQLLIQLDPKLEQRQVNKAKADLAIARANQLKAKRVYEHILARYQTERKLLTKKLVTRESVEDLKNEVAVRRAEHVVARAQVQKCVELVKEAQDRLDDTRVLAPMDGVVLHRYVQLGQIIFSGTNSASGGTLLCKMANLDQLYVRVDVDEADVGHLKPGMKARITVDALPSQRFRGTIIRINPEGTTENNVTVFEAFVELEPKAARVMKVNMTANVRITVDRQEDALLVSSMAVRHLRGERGVYVQVNGQTRFKPVRFGLNNGTDTVVLSGLREGESVILSPVKRKGGRRGPRGMVGFMKKR